MTLAVNEQTSLARLLLRAYGLSLQAVVQMKSVYGLYCKDGTRWVLKPAPQHESAARLAALAQLAEHCARQGLLLAGPVPTRQGSWFGMMSGSRWYLQPWLDGRHAAFANRLERLAAVAAVASLHKASMPHTATLAPVFPTNPLVRRLSAKEKAMQSVFAAACDHLPVLRRSQNQIFDSMATAIHVASEIEHKGAVPKVFCHRDLAQHNLLLVNPQTPDIRLIDFDCAGVDFPYLDVIQLCNHSLHFAGPDPDLFDDLITSYEAAADITLPRTVICGLLRFPDVLVRTVVEWAGRDFTDKRRLQVKAALRQERKRARLIANLG